MKMDARKQQILMAIITDYIATAEPVGSRTIAKKYRLGVSPATIRNEMSDLEEMGYIEQPHTSAGRIPSQRGYRYYVDFLMQRQELTPEEENIIRRGYETKVRDVGQVLQITGQLLSQITNYAAVVVMPRLDVGRFKHIQMVLLDPGKALVIVVQNTGTVLHRIFDVPPGITRADLDLISQVLNAKLAGQTMESIKMTLIREIYFELSKHKNILDLAMYLVQESLTPGREDKIYLGGVFNILNQPEFHNVDRVKTLLSLLEQEELLCSLLESQKPEHGVAVRIGSELAREEMSGCSMVLGTYQAGGQSLGTLGVIGPTRMEYSRVVSVMECMTRSLSEALDRILNNRKN